MHGRKRCELHRGRSLTNWVGRANPLIRVCVLELCLLGFEFALLLMQICTKFNIKRVRLGVEKTSGETK